jgi:hypothetical protein
MIYRWNDGKILNGFSAALFFVSMEIAAKRRKDSFRLQRGVIDHDAAASAG